MMKLYHPDPRASVSFAGVCYAVGDDAPDAVITAARAHGFISDAEAPVAPPAPEVIIKTETVIKSDDEAADGEPIDDQFEALNRNGLFAWLREHDVSITPPVTLDALRAACRTRATELLASSA